MKSTGWCVISHRGRRLYVFIFSQWKHSQARSSFISVHRGGGSPQSAIRRPDTSSAVAVPATHDTDAMESPSSCGSFNYSLTLAPFTPVFIHRLVIQQQVDYRPITFTTVRLRYQCCSILQESSVLFILTYQLQELLVPLWDENVYNILLSVYLYIIICDIIHLFPSIHQYIYPGIHFFIHPFVYLSIHPPIYIHLFIYFSHHPPIQSSIYSIHLSVHPSI